jgi:AraC-like DNA-binding protein
MTDSRFSEAESAPTVPTGEIPRAAIGFALDRAFADRLARATANAALLLTFQEINVDDLCDVLVVDPRRIAPRSSESSIVRRHVEANIPCVYYTASSPEALRSVVAASDVSPVRLVLFDVDDDPTTFREVIDLAPRQAHTNRLRSAMKEALRPLVPSVRTTLDMVLRRPDKFFDASDVATRVGLSRRHLDRLLTAADLAPAKNWIVAARAWNAAYLLVRDELSAETAAVRLGYADSKALRRHLGAIWNVSPTQLACADLETLLRDAVAFLATRELDPESDTS